MAFLLKMKGLDTVQGITNSTEDQKGKKKGQACFRCDFGWKMSLILLYCAIDATL